MPTINFFLSNRLTATLEKSQHTTKTRGEINSNLTPDSKKSSENPEPIKNGAPGRIRTCDHPLRRRMLYPTELRAPHYFLTTNCHSIIQKCNSKKPGRGREIRTPDILLPKQARYQTALYPVHFVNRVQCCDPTAKNTTQNTVPRQRQNTDKLSQMVFTSMIFLFFLSFDQLSYRPTPITDKLRSLSIIQIG